MESKEFIGYGKKHGQYDIIDVVLNMDKAAAHIFEHEGRRYLKFSVAARKSASEYGATHTTYVRVKAQVDVAAEPLPEKPKAKARKPKA